MIDVDIFYDKVQKDFIIDSSNDFDIKQTSLAELIIFNIKDKDQQRMIDYLRNLADSLESELEDNIYRSSL